MYVFKNILISGHILDDGRLDHHAAGHQSQMSLYGASGPLRSASSNSSSPGGGGNVGAGVQGGIGNPSSGNNGGHPHGGTPAALLVVPQPINATKMGAGLTNGTGPGRKYQCKMCPQVRRFLYVLY